MKKGMLILIISIAVLAVIAAVIILVSTTPTTLTCSGSTPNECNGQCYENCAAYHILKCDTSGAVCAADPNNCPPETPHSCNGTCWACNSGQTFVCNSSIGETCKNG